MRKIYWFLVFLLFLGGVSAFAGGDDESHPASPKIDPKLVVAEPKKSLKEDIFSVSTQDMDSSDSLNRIAGKYDTGFSSAEQSYVAKEHAGAGPLAHEKAQMDSKGSY